MNLLNILHNISKEDPEVYERLDTRRSAMREFGNLGKKLALTAVPLAMGAMFKKAYGQTPRSVFDVLNFALLLEYLESDFYNAALPTVPFPNMANRQGFGIIADHEAKHVKFLIAAITGAGGRPIAKPRFDLSGGSGSGNGPFRNAFTDYNLFLAVAQALEDTGVRAYKGQAGFLVGTGGVLTAALNIHSVEARHAAHVREERWKHNLIAGLKPWITGNVAYVPGGLVDANYAGEDMTVQAGISITNINGFSVSGEAATESFDEPLTTEQVTALVTPFFVR